MQIGENKVHFFHPQKAERKALNDVSLSRGLISRYCVSRAPTEAKFFFWRQRPQAECNTCEIIPNTFSSTAKASRKEWRGDTALAGSSLSPPERLTRMGTWRGTEDYWEGPLCGHQSQNQTLSPMLWCMLWLPPCPCSRQAQEKFTAGPGNGVALDILSPELLLHPRLMRETKEPSRKRAASSNLPSTLSLLHQRPAGKDGRVERRNL